MMKCQLHDGVYLWFDDEVMTDDEIETQVVLFEQQRRLLAALELYNAPRKITVERDESGKVTGAVSVPDAAAAHLDDRPFSHFDYDPSSPGALYDLPRIPNSK